MTIRRESHLRSESISKSYGTLHWDQQDAPNDIIISKRFVTLHPAWTGFGIKGDDIALIRTPKPISYYEQAGDVNGRKVGVGPVCVPKRGDRYSGMVSVAGWGRVEPDRVRDTTLRYVHLRLLNISDCGEYQKNFTLQRDRVEPDQIKVPGDEEPQICAGYPEGIKSFCRVCHNH